jgi:hypothetical protein
MEYEHDIESSYWHAKISIEECMAKLNQGAGNNRWKIPILLVYM